MDVATGAMGSLLPKLRELRKDEYNLQKGVKESVQSLGRELASMRAALCKLGEVPRDQLDPQVKLWADEARELSYEMDDAVDSILERVDGREEATTNSNKLKQLSEKMANLFKRGKRRHQIQISGAIKDIKEQIQEAAARRDRYRVDDIVPMPATTGDPRLKALYRDPKELVGINGKRDQELMKLLSEGDDVSERKLKIVSVVGFGGLGKTTLVKAVYDKIKGGFSCCAFVPVGRNADVKLVFRDTLYEVSRGEHDAYRMELDERQLMYKLREFLGNKRYLVVLDDIWDEKLWNVIKLAFSTKNNLGSRLITTTRIFSISKACCSSTDDSIYEMEPLSNGDSKKLFYKKIFSHESGCPDELEAVSRDILKKCGGVPLAIISMAGVLASDQCIKPKVEWYALVNSLGRGLLEDASMEEMWRILSFSYYDLPLHLKTCLLYLSMFPENLTIYRDRLVKKWIAEGFVCQDAKLIGPSNKREAKLIQELSLEDAAHAYFDELVNRNLIQPVECNNNHEVITYHISTMMHNLLIAIAAEQNFAALLHYGDIFNSEDGIKFRHLSVDCRDSENTIYSSSITFQRCRSLTVFGHANQSLLKHFDGIRVLDLEGCSSIERPDVEHICSMVLLKRLSLANTQITELPPEIGNLQCLQTLDARKSRVKELPNEVVQLTRLTHLLIGDNDSSEGGKLPDGIGKLRSLQQLCTVDLTKCSTLCVKELGELTQLKELAVVASDGPEDRNKNSTLLSTLEKSTNLQSLVVYGDISLRTIQSSSLYNFLVFRKKLTVLRTSLKVPQDIARFLGILELDIRICKLEEDDLKILGELRRLQSLTVSIEVLPRTMIRISHEGFAKLESFCVDCRRPRIIFEEGAMPKLQHLEFKLYAGSASEEPMGIKHLLNLEKVVLRYAKWYASNKGVEDTVAAMRTEAEEHQNRITLCVAEENKGGSYSTTTDEIFEEKKDASCSRMIENEAEQDRHAGGADFILDDDDQEGGLHQSNYAAASCSGTIEIDVEE